MTRIAAVIKVKVQPSRIEDLKRIFAELREKVTAQEPGSVLYHLAQSRNAPDEFFFLEVYADADAVAAHGKTPHYLALAPKLNECLAGPPTIELMDVAV